MHASQGFNYPFPDLADPIFISKLVVEDDHGSVVMASLARLTCEMYLFVDRETPTGHSERSDRTAVCRPEGTSGHAVEESLRGSTVEDPQRDPSTPSCGRAHRDDDHARQDSAQDDGTGERGAKPESAAPLARPTCETYLLADRETPTGHSERSDRTAVCRPEGTSGHAVEESLRGSTVGELEREPSTPSCGRAHRDDNDARQDSAQGDGAGERGAKPESAARLARQRYVWLLALHEAGERDLLARGLDDAHAWLPPPIARRFGRRLESLGWVRDDAWTPYCRRLNA